MPELPEVETIRRGLQKSVINKKISNVKIYKKNLIKSSYSKFVKTLSGDKFKKIQRRGKLLYFELDKNNLWLLIHLKMTGQLIYQDKSNLIAGGHSFKSDNLNSLPNKFSHIIFTFFDNSNLFFNDMRQFGYMKLVDVADLEDILSKFGIEPNQKSFTYNSFAKIFAGRKAPVKSILLNQFLISGIGNIYADEISFASKVLPHKQSNELSQSELRALWQNSNKIIKKAVAKGGTTFKDYRDSKGNNGNFVRHLKVYGRIGDGCFSCGNIINKTKIAGRTTAYCPFCQK